MFLIFDVIGCKFTFFFQYRCCFWYGLYWIHWKSAICFVRNIHAVVGERRWCGCASGVNVLCRSSPCISFHCPRLKPLGKVYTRTWHIHRILKQAFWIWLHYAVTMRVPHEVREKGLASPYENDGWLIKLASLSTLIKFACHSSRQSRRQTTTGSPQDNEKHASMPKADSFYEIWQQSMHSWQWRNLVFSAIQANPPASQHFGKLNRRYCSPGHMS